MNGFFERTDLAAQVEPHMVAKPVSIVLFDNGNVRYGSIRLLSQFRIMRFGDMKGHLFIVLLTPVEKLAPVVTSRSPDNYHLRGPRLRSPDPLANLPKKIRTI